MDSKNYYLTIETFRMSHQTDFFILLMTVLCYLVKGEHNVGFLVIQKKNEFNVLEKDEELDDESDTDDSDLYDNKIEATNKWSLTGSVSSYSDEDNSSL